MSELSVELQAAFLAESTITALTGTNIWFGNAPENHAASTDYLLHESEITEALHTVALDNYGDTYQLRIKAISQTVANAYAIGQAVKAYIKTYETTNVRSIALERDVYIYNDEDKTHILNVDFSIDYCNT